MHKNFGDAERFSILCWQVLLPVFTLIVTHYLQTGGTDVRGVTRSVAILHQGATVSFQWSKKRMEDLKRTSYWCPVYVLSRLLPHLSIAAANRQWVGCWTMLFFVATSTRVSVETCLPALQTWVVEESWLRKIFIEQSLRATACHLLYASQQHFLSIYQSWLDKSVWQGFVCQLKMLADSQLTS